MTPRTSRGILRTVALLVLLTVVATSAAATVVPTRRASPASRVHPSLPPSLSLRGRIGGLYPGRRVVLSIRIRNTGSVAVTLTRIRTRVRDASAACGASNLRVRRFQGHRWIPARGLARVRVQVRMSPDAADACQGVRFPLTFISHGTAA
jgi:hypothetical protein